jgi:hypothetical protein
LPPISVEKQRENTGLRETNRGKRVGPIKKRKHGVTNKERINYRENGGKLRKQSGDKQRKKTGWGQINKGNRVETN